MEFTNSESKAQTESNVAIASSNTASVNVNRHRKALNARINNAVSAHHDNMTRQYGKVMMYPNAIDNLVPVRCIVLPLPDGICSCTKRGLIRVFMVAVAAYVWENNRFVYKTGEPFPIGSCCMWDHIVNNPTASPKMKEEMRRFYTKGMHRDTSFNADERYMDMTMWCKLNVNRKCTSCGTDILPSSTF